MNKFIDPILVLVLLLNFVALGASRMRTVIQAVAVQGMLLGVLIALAHGSLVLWVAMMALVTILLKGVVIPRMLFDAIRDVVIRREVEPIVGFIASLFLGAVGTGLAVLFARTLPIAHGDVGSLIVPAALSTVLTGFLMLTTRTKAITQVVGYLILENGVFIFGMLLMEAIPFLVELGVLLDLFVAIFVMGIIIHKISREFSSVSTQMLSELKE
ncbi:MAG: hydrogenase [bacterium]|jgi:hydrogenase-4 component E